MMDRFVRGQVSRISPEAPVPVVRVTSDTHLPGGAGNVAVNISSLGAEVSCCGMIGKDEPGRLLLSQFKKHNVETDGIIEDPVHPTIQKTRVIAEHQQVVRFDFDTIEVLPPFLQEQVRNYLRKTIPLSDGIILSDYGKGMITKAILTEAIGLARRYKKPICVDPKVEHFLSYKGVTCITPNTNEALQGMKRNRLDSAFTVTHLGREILKRLGCKTVLITQGENGMTLFEKNEMTHIPTRAQEVYDVTGAGDTVISVFTLSLACGASYKQAALLANLAAGLVVGKLGTAIVTVEELKESLNRCD
jgi:D-beta-D-heptose 7-phosphate kinase/D-beta-D-heptose 1-phosphate adenosyltransferase